MPHARPSATMTSSISVRVCRFTVPACTWRNNAWLDAICKLLAGLTAGVVGARDLDTAERAGGQAAAVLTGERRPNRVHVVDDACRFALRAESSRPPGRGSPRP